MEIQCIHRNAQYSSFEYMRRFDTYPTKDYRLKERSLSTASCSIGIRHSTNRRAPLGCCFQCQSKKSPCRGLFHFTFRYFDGEAASQVSFEHSLKHVYPYWFAKYHVVRQFFIAAAAIAKHR